MKYKYIGFIFLFLGLSIICTLSLAASQISREISVQEAANFINNEPRNFVILDVRTPEEFNEGHLPNAQNMDFFDKQFESKIQALPKDKPILIYCRSGRRSARAVEALENEGFTKILHMHEGINGWEKSDLPLEKSQ